MYFSISWSSPPYLCRALCTRKSTRKVTFREPTNCCTQIYFSISWSSPLYLCRALCIRNETSRGPTNCCLQTYFSISWSSPPYLCRALCTPNETFRGPTNCCPHKYVFWFRGALHPTCVGLICRRNRTTWGAHSLLPIQIFFSISWSSSPWLRRAHLQKKSRIFHSVLPIQIHFYMSCANHQ